MKLDVLALIPIIALHNGPTFNKNKIIVFGKKKRIVFMLTPQRYFTRSSGVCTKQNHFVEKKNKMLWR